MSKVEPDYIEVFLFADGMTLYIIGPQGHAVRSQKVVFYKNSRKTIKAVMKRIKEIQRLNPDYKILIRNYTDFNRGAFQLN